MNTDNLKYIEVEGRKFQIRKFDAKTSLKIAKLVIAKVLPVFDSIVPKLMSERNNNQNPLQLNAESIGDMSELISLEKISETLNLIDDNDLDKIIDTSLMHCFELLPAGPVQVLNRDTTYGVSGIQDDAMLVMRLTAEAVLWSADGFFDGSRWGSVFKGMSVLSKLIA